MLLIEDFSDIFPAHDGIGAMDGPVAREEWGTQLQIGLDQLNLAQGPNCSV